MQEKFIALIHQKLRLGGVLHMATDWQPYAEHMQQVMHQSVGFVNLGNPDGYCARPDYRPITKFETRGEKLGHGVWDLLWQKAGSP